LKENECKIVAINLLETTNQLKKLVFFLFKRLWGWKEKWFLHYPQSPNQLLGAIFFEIEMKYKPTKSLTS
jgi:hypothetical protein